MKKLSLLSVFLLILSFIAIPNFETKVFADTLLYDNVTTTYTNFNDVNQISKYGNNYFLLDTSNSKLVNTSETTSTIFSTYGGTVGSLNNPTLLVALTTGDVIVYDSLNRFQTFNFNLEYQNFFNTYEIVASTTTYHTIGNISSIATDFFNNLYALDYSNNLLLKKGLNDDYLSVFYNFTQSSITLNSLSQIAVSPNGKIIAILNDDNLMVLNNDETQTVSLTQTYSKLKFDCANNLYLFKNDLELSTITKFSSANYTQTENATANLNFEDVLLDTDSGIIYYLTNNGIKQLNTATFTESATNFEYPVDFNATQKISTQALIGQTNKSTGLFLTPYSLTANKIVEQDVKIIILSQVVPQNSTLLFCFYEDSQGSNKFYIKASDVNVLQNSNNEQQYKTFYKNVKLYKYPTQNSPVVQTLIEEAELTVLNTANDYTDSLGKTFYTVSTQDGICYVNSAEVIKTNLFETEPTTPETQIDNKNQAIAFALILASLGLLTAFLIYNIIKKSNSN